MADMVLCPINSQVLRSKVPCTFLLVNMDAVWGDPINATSPVYSLKVKVILKRRDQE